MPFDVDNPYLRSEESIKAILSKTRDIDDTDLKLIWYLQENGRASFNDISRDIGISVATVSKRVSRLETIGVIQGYSAVVACEKIGFSDHLWLMVYLQPGINVEKVGIEISQFLGVKCVHEVFSQFDLLVHLCCATKEEIDQVIDMVGKVEGVSNVTKLHVNKRIKEEFRVHM
jgi:DNA-binding Lrp family transcriptional regulator